MDKTDASRTGGCILALDVGAVRIGVARARSTVGLASPLTYIEHNQQVIDRLYQLVLDNQATTLVIGLPRGLDGQETEQTKTVRAFAARLKEKLALPMYWQDEALTSKQAQAELEAKGKPFNRGDIDSLAACYILEDFLKTNERAVV